MIAHALVGMRSRNQLENGNFETSTQFFASSGTPATVERSTDGRLHIVGDGASDGVAQAAGLVLGRKYRLSFDYAVVSGALTLTKVGMPSVSALTGGATYTQYFIESDGTTRNTVITTGAGAGEFYIDNIKLQRAF